MAHLNASTGCQASDLNVATSGAHADVPPLDPLEPGVVPLLVPGVPELEPFEPPVELPLDPELLVEPELPPELLEPEPPGPVQAVAATSSSARTRADMIPSV